jgi:cell division protein FtsN
MVEVERVFEPGKEGEPEARPAAMPAPPAPDASAAAPQPVFPDVRTPVVAQERGEIWVQLGAFGSAQAAESFRERATRELSWNLEPIRVVTGEGLNRVRLGPYRNREEAEAIAAKVRESLGYAPSIIQR